MNVERNGWQCLYIKRCLQPGVYTEGKVNEKENIYFMLLRFITTNLLEFHYTKQLFCSKICKNNMFS